jgi:hypothetical protein
VISPRKSSPIRASWQINTINSFRREKAADTQSNERAKRESNSVVPVSYLELLKQ